MAVYLTCLLSDHEIASQPTSHIGGDALLGIVMTSSWQCSDSVPSATSGLPGGPARERLVGRLRGRSAPPTLLGSYFTILYYVLMHAQDPPGSQYAFLWRCEGGSCFALKCDLMAGYLQVKKLIEVYVLSIVLRERRDVVRPHSPLFWPLRLQTGALAYPCATKVVHVK